MQTIPWWNIDLPPHAADAVANAVRQRKLSMGTIVAEFEGRLGEMLGVPHVVAVSSGTSALMLALLEAGVGPGMEVIVPDRTWIATAHAAHLLGAHVVFVDVCADRPLMNVDAVEAAITPRTKAVVPVHLNGGNCDMPRLRDVAERHNILVIEDAAQALFSASTEGGWLGTHSRAGCFSLSVAKILVGGQGGFVVTHDEERARRLRLMRTHGTGDVIHAQWNFAGGNFRLTDIQAAMALTQLEEIPGRVERLKRLYQRYAEALQPLQSLSLLPTRVEHGEVPLYIETLPKDRAGCMHFMQDRGIQTRPTCPNLHTGPQFACADAPFPNAAHFENVLTLPSGPDRVHADIDKVLYTLQQYERTQTQTG